MASGERRGGNRERQRHGEQENEKMGTRQFKLGLARSVITLPILLLKTFCNKDCTASYYIALLCISNCFTLHCIVLLSWCTQYSKKYGHVSRLITCYGNDGRCVKFTFVTGEICGLIFTLHTLPERFRIIWQDVL